MNDSERRHRAEAAVWPDVLAFAIGLGLAWWFRWNTTDLVWSLWLSSLLIGYALILWLLSEPLRGLLAGMWADGAGAKAWQKLVVILLFAGGTLFGVAFFTVHFGGFHFVHSVFLNVFFPVFPERPKEFLDASVYAEVFWRYWWFLPAAAIAERHAFAKSSQVPDIAVTPEAIRKRKQKGDSMMAPYKNVLRMHALIFFFAGAHFAKLDSFAVYAVVYAVYFFPWRILRREKTQVVPAV